MLDAVDFIFMYLVVYTAMIFAMMTVFYAVYRFGVPKATKYLENHLVTCVAKKLFTQGRAMNANAASQAARAPAANEGGLMGILNHPIAQGVIGGLLQNVGQQMQQPPQGNAQAKFAPNQK